MALEEVSTAKSRFNRQIHFSRILNKQVNKCCYTICVFLLIMILYSCSLDAIWLNYFKGIHNVRQQSPRYPRKGTLGLYHGNYPYSNGSRWLPFYQQEDLYKCNGHITIYDGLQHIFKINMANSITYSYWHRLVISKWTYGLSDSFLGLFSIGE